MSTKIYEAYKFNGTAEELLAALQVWQKRFDGRFRWIMSQIIGRKPVNFDAWRIIENHFKTALAQSTRSEWDVGTCLQIFQNDGVYVIRPIYERICPISSTAIKFLSELPQLSEFYYFNNTDKPEEISKAEWQERAKFWSTNQQPIIVTFLASDMLWTMGPPFFDDKLEEIDGFKLEMPIQ